MRSALVLVVFSLFIASSFAGSFGGRAKSYSEVVDVRSTNAPLCSFENTHTGQNKFWDLDNPAPSYYGCDLNDTFSDVSLHLQDTATTEPIYFCATNQEFYAELYYCSATDCPNQNITIEQVDCPEFNETCYIAYVTGEWHLYVDGDGVGNNPFIYRAGKCPAYVAPICSYEPTASGVNTIYEMDDASPSTYGCAANYHYDDVSLHIEDTYEGDVYVCGKTANFYVEMYHCGDDFGCDATNSTSDTFETTSCGDFATETCQIVPAEGKFHMYIDGYGYGNNPIAYNLGACPVLPSSSSASAIVPGVIAFLALIAMLL